MSINDLDKKNTGAYFTGTTDGYGNIAIPTNIVTPQNGYITSACSSGRTCMVYTTDNMSSFFLRIMSRDSTPQPVINTQLTVYIRFTP